MDVKLIDVEHPEKAVAILFDVEPDILLSEMRNVISNQVADIILSNDYRFQHHEVELSRSQESSVILRNIGLPSNDKSFWMVHVSFCNPGTETLIIAIAQKLTKLCQSLQHLLKHL